jgi:hypothetical protein
MATALIVDDEPLARAHLQGLIVTSRIGDRQSETRRENRPAERP